MGLTRQVFESIVGIVVAVLLIMAEYFADSLRKMKQINIWRRRRVLNDPGLCGLENLGNTCFMNSALQCLSNTNDLKEYFTVEWHTQSGSEFALTNSFSELLTAMWNPEQMYSIPPRQFKDAIGKYAPRFLDYHQQDTQEFLIFLLQGLEEEITKCPEESDVDTEVTSLPDAVDSAALNLSPSDVHFRIESLSSPPEGNPPTQSFASPHGGNPCAMAPSEVDPTATSVTPPPEDDLMVTSATLPPEGDPTGTSAMSPLENNPSATPPPESDPTATSVMAPPENDAMATSAMPPPEGDPTAKSAMPPLEGDPCAIPPPEGDSTALSDMPRLEGDPTAISAPPSPVADGNPPTSPSDVNDDEMASSSDSCIITELFQGDLMATLTCLECEKVTEVINPFMFLPVPLPEAHEQQYTPPCSIKDCIQLLTKELSSNEKDWFCPICEVATEVKRKLTIVKMPKILIVYLKRFYLTRNGGYKRHMYVDIPKQLDLGVFSVKPTETCQYKLYAVINHSGNIQCGHCTPYCLFQPFYCSTGPQHVVLAIIDTAFAKNKDQWYKFDDTEVECIEQDNIVFPGAYVLFYENADSVDYNHDIILETDVRNYTLHCHNDD